MEFWLGGMALPFIKVRKVRRGTDLGEKNQ